MLNIINNIISDNVCIRTFENISKQFKLTFYHYGIKKYSYVHININDLNPKL